MPKRRSPQARLRFESLETRRLMAADVVEQEFNGRQASANEFDLPTTGSVTLVGQSRSHDDKDFFVFQAPADGRVNLSVSANGPGAQAEVEDQFGRDIFETEPNDGVNSGSFRIEAGQWYYVRMRSVDDAASNYRTLLSLEDPSNDPNTPPDDPGTPDPAPADVVRESEPNNRRSAADQFDLGDNNEIALRGTANKRDKDFFVFTVDTSGTLQIDVRSLNGRAAKVTVEDAQERDLFESEPNDGINSGRTTVEAGQRYFVRVRGVRGESDYQVNLRLDPADANSPAISSSTNSPASNQQTSAASDSRQKDRREDRREDRRDASSAARDVLFAELGSRRGRGRGRD